MSDNTYVAPTTALEAFNILTADLHEDDTAAAAADLAEQIFEYVVLPNGLELLAEDIVENGRETFDDVSYLFRSVTFAQVAELSSGNERAYSDGLVSLWVNANTQGFGRDRPGSDKGIYVEMKLDVPWNVRTKIDKELAEHGIDLDDLSNAVMSDGYIESDVLESIADGDWEMWVDADVYPALHEAAKRAKRSYKGIFLAHGITIAEAVELDHALSTGFFKRIADNLAIDWLTQSVVWAIQVAYDLEDQPELYDDGDGNWTLNVNSEADEDKLIVAKIATDNGKRLREVNRTTYEMV